MARTLVALTLLPLGIGEHDGWGMDIQLETFAHYVQNFKFCNRHVTAARPKAASLATARAPKGAFAHSLGPVRSHVHQQGIR